MLLLIAMIGCGAPAEDTSPPEDTGTIPHIRPEITTQGDPDWEVGLIELFQAPLDPAVETCLFEGNHSFSGGNWLPGTAHDGPYEAELTEAISRCGYAPIPDDTLTAEEWSDPNALWMGVVIVPKGGGVQGSTPDGPVLDMIADNRFPLVYDADVRRDEVIVDLSNDGSFPGVLDLGFMVNGHSHVVLAFGSNLTRMPAGASAPGEYTWNLSLRDATSANQGDQGYDIVVPFEVVE